jgi:endonuclease/exonuclease/phosphatase family metal-dependent hydrolase
MPTRKLVASLIAAASLASVCSTLVPATAVAQPTSSTAASSVKTPSAFVSVKATPGPKSGQVTLSWKQDGKNTNGYKFESALTIWSKTDPSLSRTGRHHTTITIPDHRSSYTLSAAQVKAAGAAVETGNHLYFRLYAVNKTKAGTKERASKFMAVMPKAVAPKASGSDLRVVSFNVRSAKATGDKRVWLERADDVAKSIVARNPGIAALQELGAGRADGKSGTTNGTARQTESLLSKLASVGGSKYRLVRTTPYAKPGTVEGTQGARILYDTTRYQLVSHCSDKTGSSNYSGSCTIKMPILSTDGESQRRRAAYAEFKNRRTGEKFFFVSVHLDNRQSANLTTGKKLNALRGAQVKTVTAAINKLNTHGEEVVVAGDMNSWQNNPAGNAPHDYLVTHGYYDTASALSMPNVKYPTVNHFDTVLAPNTQGFGARLDMILVKGAKGASTFANVTKPVDANRPSDHNMVYTDIAL